MKIEDALARIKAHLESNKVYLTRHVEERMRERNLDKDSTIKSMKESEILGIVEQDEITYKMWFRCEGDTDLNVIVRIDIDRLVLITAFACKSIRRKKDGEG